MTSTSPQLHYLYRLHARRLVSSAVAMTRYLDDPVAFVHDCVAWEDTDLASYQEELLAELVLRGRISARGPHGLGKTSLSALAVLWFAVTRDAVGLDWKCATTAGAWRQLEHYLWPEIHKWARRLRWDRIGRDPFDRDEHLRLRLVLNHGQAFAMASDVPALLEGVHADSVLYVFDEAKSIPSATFDAAEGAFANVGNTEALAIANSTPGEPSGRFYDIHARRAGLEDWWCRHVSLDEAIAAGRVSRDWADQRARQWGTASSVYQNRVLGEFAAADEESVIPLSWVEAAIERWQAWSDSGADPGMVTRIGVDVARSGQDRTCYALRHDMLVSELRFSHHEDTMATTGRVGGVMEQHPAAVAVVDTDGLGAGVTDRLRERFDPELVQAFHAGAGTTVRDRSGELGFADVRSAAWWRLREMLDPSYDAVLALPPEETLLGDLTAPHWRIGSNSKIKVEAKDEVRKRLGRSTDAADAVIMACWPGEPGPMAPVMYSRRLV